MSIQESSVHHRGVSHLQVVTKLHDFLSDATNGVKKGGEIMVELTLIVSQIMNVNKFLPIPDTRLKASSNKDISLISQYQRMN
jgi:hypothetical protein